LITRHTQGSSALGPSIWLGGLATAVAIGFALTPAVARGSTSIRVICGVLGALMIVGAQRPTDYRLGCAVMVAYESML
jgi:hypothetical protein